MTQMSKQDDASRPSPTESCCAGLGELLEARFFKALGDSNRIALLARLASACHPCTVSEVSCCCPVDLSVVSRHLAQLREAGIVQCQRQGKEVHYSVRYDVLAQTFRQLADAIDACCPPAADSPQTEEDQP